MAAINNQKGYTLILVLIIITVIMILGIALSGATLNARKQFSQTENRNKATDLAEMGITHYLSVTNSLIKSAQDTNMCSEIESLRNAPVIQQTVEGQNRYEITFDPNTTTNPCTSDLKTIFVGFKSEGITDSGYSVTLNGTFKLVKKTRAGESVLSLAEILKLPGLENYGIVAINQQDNTTINNLAFFTSLTLHGQGNYVINNDAYFEQTISLNGQTRLTINGDAIFFKQSGQISKDTNKAELCITGNTYYVKDGKLADLDLSENQCADTNTNNNWSIDPDTGISVTYPK